MKIYLEIYAIYGVIMELNGTIAFLFQLLMWDNNSSSFVLNYVYYSLDSNTDCTTRPPCIQSLVTRGITGKAAYLSKATK